MLSKRSRPFTFLRFWTLAQLQLVGGSILPGARGSLETRPGCRLGVFASGSGWLSQAHHTVLGPAEVVATADYATPMSVASIDIQ